MNRKLLRDVWRLRGQVLSIAALVSCGVATVVAMYGSMRAIARARDDFYARYRFADVFASATRAPDALAARIAAIPGVATVETRATLRVSLDVPGLALPAGGLLLSVPEQGEPALDGVHVVRGRMVRPRSTDEVVLGAGFAEANHLQVGDSLGAVLDGRWRRLRVVGLAIAPSSRGSSPPRARSRWTRARSACCGCRALPWTPRRGCAARSTTWRSHWPRARAVTR
ncbi:MacB-like periplasmic core domain protein (plasmid) [Gemmatirosa kalamazoonensis]|uniref:MacB-like periplasmic core domain protein n=1 Tax=Gemmatirosa kalamazoonensis TaxID=861299 RepID=W0RNL1_9BACT|nr:ABC transporter permease [Gemmatirosa kalamazoonensis]AHG92599.1 MacB-like periplasmic core domain protein [Gemmatirosa kalamazoonensis]